MFFVIQKKHNKTNDTWDNNVHSKTTLDEAFHQFHAFMSTYAYGQSANLDYCACAIEQDDGLIIKNEIDDKRGQTPVELEE